MRNEKVIIGVSIGVVVLILAVIGISYALWYLVLAQDGSNDIITDCFNLTLSENNNISLQNAFPLYDEDGKKLDPYTFTIKNNCASYTNYEVHLEIADTSTLNEQYLKIMVDDNNPVLISSLEATEPTEKNVKSSYIITRGISRQNEEKTYNLRVWLDENVTTETEGVQNSKWSAKISVKATYINTSTSFCEINPDTAACGILAKGETNELLYDGTTDNNLRYVGSDPNNYVSFNNELWRIIGVMNNVNDGTNNLETRLKIVRNESIGNYSWNNTTSRLSDWSVSTLQQQLNTGAYWNRTTGNCPYGQNGITTPCDFSQIGLTEDARTMVDNAVWNLGNAEKFDTSTTGLPSDWYVYERDSIVYNGNSSMWIGKVGLIYPSDYGYATSGGNTYNREACMAKELLAWSDQTVSDCKNNDWLLDSTKYYWTLTTYIGGSSTFLVHYAGLVLDNPSYEKSEVYPALYLSSDVKITSGDGSYTNPYQLSL